MATKQKSGGYNPELMPNTCQVPNVILDHWMATFTGAEFKVAMYAVRRTYGFGRKSNRISKAQFINGLSTKDGEIRDRGTGLSEPSVKNALASLVEKGVLRTRPNKAKTGADAANTYSLNLAYLPPVPDPEDEARGGKKLSPTGDQNLPSRGGQKIIPSGGVKIYPPLNIERNPERNPGDLPSVDPSAHATPAREGSTVDSEAGPTDRPTDRQTEENAPTKNTEASTTVQLLEPEEPHHEQSNTVVLSPKEDDDNDSPSAEEALRQRTEALRASVEAISNDEVSEEAQQLGREVLAGLPSLSDGRDRCRVGKLAEHYLRGQRPNVLRDATDRVARQSRREKINSVWRYLTKSCAEAEDGYSEGDEALLRSLSGENTISSSEESQPSGYEWFFDSDEQESDTGEDQQRQHTPDPDPEALKVWERVLEDVSGEINAPSLRVWFEGTIPVSLTAETLTISVPNSFAREYIESRFKELLEGALAKVLSPTSGLEIVVGLDGQTANKGGG